MKVLSESYMKGGGLLFATIQNCKIFKHNKDDSIPRQATD